MAPALRYGFPRVLRLLKTDDYSSVFSLRSSSSNEFFQVLARPNGLPHGRIGLVVGKKTHKRAVVRNYIRRSAREVFRLNAAEFSGLDLVVRSRRAFDRKEGEAARRALLSLFRKQRARHAPAG
ncbi:ribonuclease P protein component [Jeongeupia sp. HS-3]|uniref:ribonuclease P protein component n=1 Tax=Jeongeupia sp. HS-3 TaxID=1009682 RepID=UPI0018A548B7|nr:ribonuclease P protein component [Jeongeupia sp. HS-3]BCL76797.1 ribonuclease P protein component [Jeongeupia sp. HS-3]